ncbi:MAG: AgmX/PglI C-terminal domain-containing protein [Polyangiales bacterium]
MSLKVGPPLCALLLTLPLLACGHSAPAKSPATTASSSDDPDSKARPPAETATSDVFKTAPTDRCAAVDALPWPRDEDERKTHKKLHIRMREEGATATGPVGPKAAKQVIRMHLHELRSCYEKVARKEPTLKGTVAVSFKITLAGRARAMSLACSTLKNDAVASCIQSVIEPLEFPPDESSETDVVYPLEFETWSDPDAPTATPPIVGSRSSPLSD